MTHRGKSSLVLLFESSLNGHCLDSAASRGHPNDCGCGECGE